MTADYNDCCAPDQPPTPVDVHNRPSLDRIDYRVGTYDSFRSAMIRAIAREPRLKALTARTSDDYGIAFVEMWAYLADILTFYQERYAQEAFLGTAVERDSLERMAAMLAYVPSPGMAAATHLAFTLDDDASLEIPERLRVQSVPGPGQKPQKFETVETLEADARLNRLRIYQKSTHDPWAAGSTHGTLAPNDAEEVAAPLVPGSRLVLVTDGDNVEEKAVEAIEEVDWRTALRWAPAHAENGASLFAWRRKFRLFGHDGPEKYMKLEEDPNELGGVKVTFATHPEADYDTAGDNHLDLDTAYEDIQVGSEILLVHGTGTAKVLTVAAVDQEAVEFAPVKATVTRLTVGTNLTAFDRRRATIYELVSPAIAFWEGAYLEGDGATLTGTEIWLREEDLAGAEIASGRKVLLVEEQEGGQAVLATIQADPEPEAIGGVDHLKLSLSTTEALELDAASAVLHGNVAEATHGETVSDEVLGDGDAAADFQSFTLKKAPVTFVADAASTGGVAGTLELRVDDVQWSAVGDLFEAGGNERVYATEVDGDGAMTVRFGDGTTGARLPSGRKNVTALYRVGLGEDGNLDAGAIANLLDRPKGLKGATNPVASVGGTEPEDREQLRENAPNTVRTFERVVSLRDFEDAAREYVGVAKARAYHELDAMGEQVVTLTVAGEGGEPVVLQDVRDYLDARRDTNRKLVVQDYDPKAIDVQATVAVDPDYLDEVVVEAARAALVDHFAFDNRDFGQAVHVSDVYRVLQEVEGVVGALVTKLHPHEDPASLEDRIPIEPNRIATLEIVEITAGSIPS